MGEVYLAEHPRLERRDALKVLAPQLSADRDFAQRFRREANLTASLWHPHIVGVHDVGVEAGRLWLSMDYVDGTDAARLLSAQPNGIPVADVIDIVAAVAGALDFAHQCGLLHRDVKPANILITAKYAGPQRIVLADFGIARHVDDVSGLTATNMTVGTLRYSAPEQLMGEEIDGRADQYGLAASAYHLLTGVPLFDVSNPAVVISRHLNAPPPLIGDLKPELRALDAIFNRALAKAPAERFATCTQFSDLLQGAVAGDATALSPVPVSSARRRDELTVDGAQEPTPAATAPNTQSPNRDGESSGSGPRRTAVVIGGTLILLVVAALVSTMIVVAGDKSDDPPAAAAPPGAPQTPAPPTRPTPIALPPEITKTGTIVVGTNVPYAPAEFRAMDGTLAGFDVDIIRAIADELGVTADIRDLDFADILPTVASHGLDVGMAAMTDTKQRQQRVDMVNYYQAGTMWAQRRGAPTIDPNNACGLRVAVQNTTFQQTDELPMRSRACQAAGQPAINVLSYYSLTEAFDAVGRGDADAVTADSPQTGYGIKESSSTPTPLIEAGGMFDVAPYGWAVRKGSPLGAVLQEALQRLIDDGRYEQILRKWGVEVGAITRATINGGF